MDSIQLGIKISADGKGAESTINSLNKTIEKVGDSSAKASQSLGGIEKATQGLSSAATTAGRALAGLGVAISTRQLIQTADAYSGIVAKLKLVSGSTQEFVAAQSQLFAISQRNMTPLAETVQLYSRLATSMRDLGRSQAETLAITDLVGKSIRISGADAASAAAGILQFSQAIGSGVLRGDEFNSMMENSPRLAKALADGLKVPIGSLREMAAQGQLTADKVINAILSQSDAIKREYTTMPVTVSGAFQQIQNALTQYVGQTDQASGSSRELAESISLIAKNLTTILDPMAKMVSAMVNGWAKIFDSIKQVRIALGDLQAYKEQFGVIQAISKDEWLQRGGGGGQYTTGGGFGTDEASKPFFDGVNKSAQAYINAANAAWKLNAAQKAVVETIVKIGTEKGFDPVFLLSIAKAETQLGNLARVSSAGAKGIFQFMDGTAKRFGVNDPWNLEQATHGAIKYLGKLKDQFGSVKLAAAGYNAGEGAVSKYGNNVPPYKETQTYVKRVLTNYQDLQRAMGASSTEIGKELVKVEDDYYKHRLSLIDQLKSRQLAANELTVAQQKAALEKLKIAATDAQKNAEVKIKMAIDQQSLDTAIQAIDAAKAQQENLLRDASSLGNQDVAKARIELSAIQKEVMEAQKSGNWQEKQIDLTTKREVAEKKLAQAKIAAGSDDLQLQAALAANAEKYDAMKREAMKGLADLNADTAAQQRQAQEAELAYLQKQEGFNQAIAEQAAQGAKAAIDSQLQQQAASVAQQQAERDALAQNLTGLAQIQQQRQNITLNLQDQLGLIEAEKQATQAKLAIDQQMLGYQEQMLQAQLAATQERERRLEIENAIAQVHLQQADNLRAAQNAATRANAEAAKEKSGAGQKMQGLDTKEVRESQLEMNAFWDQYIQRIEEYNKVWEQASGGTTKGFAQMIMGAAQYAKTVDQIGQKYKDLNTGNKTKFAERLGDFAGLSEGLDQASAAFGMLGQQFAAMAAQQEKGSAAWKQYNAMAMASVAVAQVAALAQGLLAVATAMASDAKVGGFGAIAAGVAVAATLASFGIQMAGAGGGGGGSSQNSADSRQKAAGAGTVFGDSSAKSESIAKSLEIIRDNSSNDLNYSAGMLRALESIDASIKGTTNAALLNFRDLAMSMADKGAGYAGINDNTSISDWGMAFSKRALEVILKQGMSLGDVYVSNNRTGIDSKASLGANGPGKEIARTIQGISDALIEGGKAFGLTGDDFKERLKGFVVDLGIISLKGLNGDDIEKQFSAIMSNLSDKMAEQFMPGLDDFRKVGEGYAETFWRAAEGINRANGEMEKLGLTAINYQDIINKQGDVAAEITRQTLLTQTRLADGVKAYVNELTGSAEDIIAAYKQLVDASNLMKTGGFGDANLDRTMINAAGGLDAFVQAMADFNDNFLTAGENVRGQALALSDQFNALGVAMPVSKESFRALVSGIDTSTEAGKKLFGQLIALSGGFADLADKIQGIKDKYADILDPFKPFSDQIKGIGDDFATLIGKSMTDYQSVVGGNQQTINNAIAGKQSQLGPLQAAIDQRMAALFNLYSEQDKWQAKLDKELAKKPKNQDKKRIAWFRQNIDRLQGDIGSLIEMNRVAQESIRQINDDIAKLQSQSPEDPAKLAARDAEIAKYREQAGRVMADALEGIFNTIAQTMEKAQQRLESVLALQTRLENQLAQLQGPGAILGLANANYGTARQNIVDYIGGVQGGAGRNVDTELSLIQAGQQAVMDKYNAEIAAIQEAEREFIAAETDRLNAALELQIDAINAATEAAIEAENDRLNAAIKAQQKIDAAALKAKQKEFDAANKLTQKQFDAEQKALQKVHDAQLKALGDELDAANKLKDAIASINDYVRGMALGGNSPLSPEQRLAEAQKQYQDLLARAQGGDADAMQKLSGASDAYLEAAKTYYGSSTAYGDIFDGVKNAMSSIGGMSAPDPDSIQSRIDALREAQAEQMDALRESQAERLDAIREAQGEQLDAMREAQQESLDAMREASQKTQEEIRKAAQAQIEAAQKATQQAIADLSDPTKNAAMKAAREAAERDLRKLQELAELTRQEAQRQADEAKAQAAEQARRAMDLANAQLEQLQAGTRLNRSQVEALNGILRGLNIGYQAEIPAYAQGGYAKPGLALVGEQGPEIVRFERPAQVMTADETRDALRGGGDDKIVQAIAELKAEMRAVVITQSNANPQIIEKLSGMEQRLSKIERNARIQA